MTFDYQRPLATADQLLKRFGQRGAIRKQVRAGSPSNPTITWVEHPATLAVTSYTAREIDGTRIRADDLKVLVSPQGLAVEPTTADRLVEASGVGNPASPFLSIVNVERVSPAGVTVLFILQCRR